MSKNILWGIVAIAAIIALAVWYFMSLNGAGPTGSREINGETPAGKRSMRELLASGQSQKCTFSEAVEDSSFAGTVYFAGGRMRGDFESESRGRIMGSHMIVVDNTGYVWGSEAREGMKMTMETGAGADVEEQGAVDYDAAIGYSCEPWSADSGVFELPKNVTFTDLGGMMKNIPTGQ